MSKEFFKNFPDKTLCEFMQLVQESVKLWKSAGPSFEQFMTKEVSSLAELKPVKFWKLFQMASSDWTQLLLITDW